MLGLDHFSLRSNQVTSSFETDIVILLPAIDYGFHEVLLEHQFEL